MGNAGKRAPVSKAPRLTSKRRAVSAPTTAMSADAKRQRSFAVWRSAIFALLGVLSVANTTAVQGIEGNFSFWVDKVGGTEVSYSIPVVFIWSALSVSLLVTAYLQLARGFRFKWRVAIGLISPLFLFAAIASLLDGTTANLTVFFSSTLSFAIPVGIGALAGIVAERSGFLNIAVEGKLLFAAMVAAIVSSVTGSVIAGPISGAITGAVVSLSLAWLGIRYRVDHIIAGTVINIAAVGVTSFMFQRILQPFNQFNRPVPIDPISLPLLSDIPVLGPILFALSPYFYIAVGLILFFTYMIYRTRWGLRLRAAGEQPSAAGTVGIDVVKLRYRAMLIAGLLAGFAGSFISLSGTGGFGMNVSAGKGFIALAAVIFGAWNPIYAFGASLVFGITNASSDLLGGLGVSLPVQVTLSIPWVVTIIVVAGLIGRVRSPASAGRPYDQG